MKGKCKMGVLRSNLRKKEKLRCSFMVGGYPSVALNNLAILILKKHSRTAVFYNQHIFV